eukprot:scaffold263742_cov35-Attheya_sp.AAC.1
MQHRHRDTSDTAHPAAIMNTPATIGKPGRRPTLASTKSFRYPLFVVMVLSLLLPAAVKTCRTKLKERGSPTSKLVPFTDTGGITLQDAVTAFVADGRVGWAVLSTGT